MLWWIVGLIFLATPGLAGTWIASCCAESSQGALVARNDYYKAAYILGFGLAVLVLCGLLGSSTLMNIFICVGTLGCCYRRMMVGVSLSTKADAQCRLTLVARARKSRIMTTRKKNPSICQPRRERVRPAEHRPGRCAPVRDVRRRIH